MHLCSEARQCTCFFHYCPREAIRGCSFIILYFLGSSYNLASPPPPPHWALMRYLARRSLYKCLMPDYSGKILTHLNKNRRGGIMQVLYMTRCIFVHFCAFLLFWVSNSSVLHLFYFITLLYLFALIALFTFSFFIFSVSCLH